MWHPNISPLNGSISLYTNNVGEQWTPILTLSNVLSSLRTLLRSPDPNLPINLIGAKQYFERPECFILTAQHWSNVYANGPIINPEYYEMVQYLVDMGVDVFQARLALSEFDWILDLGVSLFNGMTTNSNNNT